LSWLTLASIENKEIKEPDTLRGSSSGSYTYSDKELASEVIFRKSGKHFSISCDLVYDRPFSPFITKSLKALGYPVKIDRSYKTVVYPIKKSGEYKMHDIALLSYTIGEKWKKRKDISGTDKPVIMHSLLEIYPVEYEPVTVEESIAIHKNKPEKTGFIIPETVPPVDSATQRMIDRSKL